MMTNSLQGIELRPSPSRRIALLLAVAITCAVVPGARAQERVDLRVHLPAEALHCLHQGSLAEGIDARVREEGLATGAVVEVRGEPAGETRWRLDVAIAIDGEAIGERELVVSEAECETVVEALAVVVVLALRGSSDADGASPDASDDAFVRLDDAWAIDATGVPSGSETGLPGAAADDAIDPAPERPSSSVDRADAMARADAADLDVRLRLLGGFGVAAGTSGPVAVTAGVGVEIALAGDLSLGLSAGGTLPASVDLAGGELVLSSVGGRLYGCTVVSAAGRVALDGCIGASAGVLRANARGFAVNGTSDDPYATLVASGRLRLRLVGPLFVLGEASVEVPVLRPSLVVRDTGGANAAEHRLSLVSLSGTAGVGLELP